MDYYPVATKAPLPKSLEQEFKSTHFRLAILQRFCSVPVTFNLDAEGTWEEDKDHVSLILAGEGKDVKILSEPKFATSIGLAYYQLAGETGFSFGDPLDILCCSKFSSLSYDFTYTCSQIVDDLVLFLNAQRKVPGMRPFGLALFGDRFQFTPEITVFNETHAVCPFPSTHKCGNTKDNKPPAGAIKVHFSDCICFAYKEKTFKTGIHLVNGPHVRIVQVTQEPYVFNANLPPKFKFGLYEIPRPEKPKARAKSNEPDSEPEPEPDSDSEPDSDELDED